MFSLSCLNFDVYHSLPNITAIFGKSSKSSKSKSSKSKSSKVLGGKAKTSKSKSGKSKSWKQRVFAKPVEIDHVDEIQEPETMVSLLNTDIDYAPIGLKIETIGLKGDSSGSILHQYIGSLVSMVAIVFLVCPLVF